MPNCGSDGTQTSASEGGDRLDTVDFNALVNGKFPEYSPYIESLRGKSIPDYFGQLCKNAPGNAPFSRNTINDTEDRLLVTPTEQYSFRSSGNDFQLTINVFDSTSRFVTVQNPEISSAACGGSESGWMWEDHLPDGSVITKYKDNSGTEVLVTGGTLFLLPRESLAATMLGSWSRSPLGVELVNRLMDLKDRLGLTRPE